MARVTHSARVCSGAAARNGGRARRSARDYAEHTRSAEHGEHAIGACGNALNATAARRSSPDHLRAEADKLVGCTSWGSTRAARRPWPCWPTATAASSARAAPARANLQTDGELEVEKILHTVIEQRHGRPQTSRRPRSASAWPASIARTTASVIRDIMRRLGFRSNTLIVNDALIALVAGAGVEPGRGRDLGNRVDRLRREPARASPRAPAAGARRSATKAPATGSGAGRWPR